MGDESSDPNEEFVPDDDAVIGRAFRRSLVVIAVVAAVALAVFVFRRGTAPGERVLAKDVGEIADLMQATEEMPRVVFTDVTEEAGIRFVHTNGARGEKLLPETMGSGAAFFDYDGDRAVDLFLVNAKRWPGDPAGGALPSSALYRNVGNGKFEDVTAGSGLGVVLYGTGVAVGDYDADGDDDLFLAALGANHLYRNDAGLFVDVTGGAAVAGREDDWSTSAGFLDYDGDGDLDLALANNDAAGGHWLYRNDLPDTWRRRSLQVWVRAGEGQGTVPGAEVHVRDAATGEHLGTRLIDTGGGYCSQGVAPVFFAFAASVESVAVSVVVPTGGSRAEMDVGTYALADVGGTTIEYVVRP
jgi:hypothetical protein